MINDIWNETDREGIDSCSIDDDTTKRSKKLEEMQGGVIMDKDKTLVRDKDMIDCATKCIEEPDIKTWHIEDTKYSGFDAYKMVTRKHTKKTFSFYYDTRYLT